VLSRTGVRTALAYLRIGLDPGNIARADVAETLRRPSRRIAPKVAEMLTESPRTSLSRIRGLAGRLTGGDGPKVADYAADVDLVVRAVAERDTAGVIAVIRQDVGLGDVLDTLDSSRRELDRSTHADDLAALEQVAQLHPEPATFEEWLRRSLADRPPGGGVTLSTVHRVKGREWPRVVVFGANAGLLPHRLAESVEEERRVFHVAITRGVGQVVVVADSAVPSPFVGEMSSPRPPGADHVGGREGAGRGDARRDRGRAAAGAGAGAGAGDRSAAGGRRGAGAPTGFRRQRPAEELKGASAELFERLAAWRRSRAAVDKVPAYVVFSDAALRGVADAAPKDLVALGQCWGVGPAKLERYGDEVLAVIEAQPPSR
ncbi:MAG TPA: HRDC domain-containing protein, partial [Acidimicrobiales bacterium]|nr:HRDC domain-containing protein [Acidimicrobiales bacterium]